MKVLVQEAMTHEVFTLFPESTFQEAIQLMLDHKISAIPIVEPGTNKLLGLLRTEDLIIKDKNLHLPFFMSFLGGIFPLNADQFEEDLKKAVAVEVREMMNPSPVTIFPEETLSEAATLMSDHHLKSLPVINSEKQLVGIISQRDIIRHLAQG